MKKSQFAGLLILLAFGAVKFNIEQRLTEEHRAAFFHGAKLGLSLRQQLTQAELLAALGGFRAVVADFLWIEGHVAWEQTEWGRMELLFRNATALQPRNVEFWDVRAWHLGYNVSLAALNDKIHQPDEKERVKNQHEYWKAAEKVYLEGINNNPDNYFLYQQIARFYEDKPQDYLKAYECYTKAASFPHAPTFLKRMAAYDLVKVPGKEREAYDLLAKYYKMGPNERLPSVLSDLKYLEKKLNIPPAERVYNPDSQ